jgi:NAD(P)-dependent dehydrogenase (short-subunit alcohol dehydrogenase family)
MLLSLSGMRHLVAGHVPRARGRAADDGATLASRRGVKLRDRVVVITGASSGLGRAIALEMAGRGARLVLAARRADELEATAALCRAAGARATTVPTDVSSEADVDRLAEQTLARCGRIDVWINNAAVTLFALLEQGSFAPHRRVLETNLFGAIYGARAVLPVFREQRCGVLINVGSVLSEVGHAFVPSYVISKYGLRGLTEALRVEVADLPDVHVCTIVPYAIDTQHFETAANELGRKPYALPPVQRPEKVARAVARLAERPRRVRHVPRLAVLGLAFHALRPRLAERLLKDALGRWHLDGPTEPLAGNLYAPSTEPAAIQGTRPPRLGVGRFMLWLLVRGARIELERAGHGLRALLARLRPRRALP